ncbi:hypothetical protein D3C73_998330 [compost metagenome]
MFTLIRKADRIVGNKTRFEEIFKIVLPSGQQFHIFQLFCQWVPLFGSTPDIQLISPNIIVIIEFPAFT